MLDAHKNKINTCQTVRMQKQRLLNDAFMMDAITGLIFLMHSLEDVQVISRVETNYWQTLGYTIDLTCAVITLYSSLNDTFEQVNRMSIYGTRPMSNSKCRVPLLQRY